MTSSAPSPDGTPTSDDLPEVVIRRKRGVSIIWIIPIVAGLIGAWLWYEAIMEQGPTITIEFETADDLEAGKTKIKFKNVEVGEVETITFKPDLSGVIVTVEMAQGAKPYMRSATRFWVVRPRIGRGGISGLGTLVSGAYISIEPSEEGDLASAFVGLELPPATPYEAPGLKLKLHAADLGNLGVGCSVLYRGVHVGQVEEHQLDEDGLGFQIWIYIEERFEHLVSSKTEFWNASGLDVSFGAEGLRVTADALDSLLTGAVAFGHSDGDPVANGTEFQLFPNREASREDFDENVPFSLYFSESIRGLSVSAPVEFRGIKLGEVTNVGLEFDNEGLQARLAVTIMIQPGRVKHLGRPEADPTETFATLIERGLRAQLVTGSFLTGALFVDLQVHPDKPAVYTEFAAAHPEIPTIPSTAATFAATLEDLPVLIDEARKAVAGIEHMVNSPEVADTLSALRSSMDQVRTLTQTLDDRLPAALDDVEGTAQAATSALDQARDTLASIGAMASQDSELNYRVGNALEELAASMRALRVLTDYLERHPEALLRGKPTGGS